MKIDSASVRITVSKHDEAAFLAHLGVPEDQRFDRPRGIVELHFTHWDHPAASSFHFEGIPWSGFHEGGDSFEPHRMCGSGDACLEIYADQEAHLYVLIDEETGLPNEHSRNAVEDYLYFERECRTRRESRSPTTTAG